MGAMGCSQTLGLCSSVVSAGQRVAALAHRAAPCCARRVPGAADAMRSSSWSPCGSGWRCALSRMLASKLLDFRSFRICWTPLARLRESPACLLCVCVCVCRVLTLPRAEADGRSTGTSPTAASSWAPGGMRSCWLLECGTPVARAPGRPWTEADGRSTDREPAVSGYRRNAVVLAPLVRYARSARSGWSNT